MTPPIQPHGVAAQQIEEVAAGQEVIIVNEEIAPIAAVAVHEDPPSDHPSDPQGGEVASASDG